MNIISPDPSIENQSKSVNNSEKERAYCMDGSHDYYSKSRSRKYRAYKYRNPAMSK
jgi:hypothetical protein